MKNIVLTNESIRNRCLNEMTYTRGENYYKRGQVIYIEEMLCGSSYHSEVAGNNRIYTQMLEFNKYGILERSKCNCPAFSSYPGHCKHVVAALLALKDYIAENSQPQISDENEIEAIMESFQATNIVENLQELMLEFQLSYDKPYVNADAKYYLSMKIGVDRLYVVADIEKLMTAIYYQLELEITKKFSYYPDQHSFNEKDERIIKLLLELYELDAEVKTEAKWNNGIFNGKTVMLSRSYLLRLLDILCGDYLNFNFNGNLFEQVPIFAADLPIKFELSEAKDNLELSVIDGELAIPLFNDGLVYFYREIIYIVSQEQNKAVLPIFQSYNRLGSATLTIPTKYKHSFVSGILQQFQTDKNNNTTSNINIDSIDINSTDPNLIGTNRIIIDEQVQKRLYKVALTPVAKFDYVDGVITCDLKYHYGDFVINPFDNNQIDNNLINNKQISSNDESSDKILIRELNKEDRIMNFFEINNFRYSKNLMYLDDEYEMFNFIAEKIPELHKQAQVMLSESFYHISKSRSLQLGGRVSINKEINVLEIGFDIEGIDRSELSHILNAIKEKKRYYRLRDGGFLPLESEYNFGVDSFTEMIAALNLKKSDFQKDIVQLPLHQALLIDDTRFVADEAFTRLINRIKQPTHIEYQLPQQVAAILRPYQQTGYQWFRTLADYGFGGILADDMGLGKTIQAISFIASLLEKSTQPAIVIAPTSLVYNWQNEFGTFAPNLKVMVVTGNHAERQEQLASIKSVDVIITSYPLIRRDIDRYVEMTFVTCIIDEAQFLKNHATLTAKAVKQLRAKTFFALTGTPIENSISDLWSIFDIVLPKYFPPLKNFLSLYNKPENDNGIDSGIGSGVKQLSPLGRLHERVKPFVMRRLKKDVLQELPPKIENKLISVLTTDQKKLYLAYLEQIKGQVNDIISHDGFNKGQIKILALLTRLRQICCHPALFVENYLGESGKLIQLMELLNETIAGGHRVLIFSQFASMLQLIRAELEKEGYSHFYLDGSTPALDRIGMANKFNEGENSIFLISLKAGGTGLNLTGADTVILYDLWWNPAVEDQATDRAHRIGQEKVVQVIRLIAQGTIEEKIYELQKQKRQVINEVIQSGETLLTRLTEAEIRMLLEI